MNERPSSFMLEGETTALPQYTSASEASTLHCQHQQSTSVTQPRHNYKGKKNVKGTFFVDKSVGCQILFTDSITNLKNKKLFASERMC